MNKRSENSRSRHHGIILDSIRDDDVSKVYRLSSEHDDSTSTAMCNYQRIGKYINSCNGLLYFEDHRDGETYIWNPTTDESKLIPHPQSLDARPPGLRSSIGCTGLGFDSRSNDYKIVTYVDHLNDHDDDDDREGSFVELYSLKTDSWKRLTDFPCLAFTNPCVYADGCFYWLSPLIPYYSIISFDFAGETFSSFSVEGISASLRGDSFFVDIVECGGCLGVVAAGINSPCFEIWLKTTAGSSSSWDKRWDFSLPQLQHHYPAHEIFILGFSGEILYLAASNDEVFAYDCAAGHLEKLEIRLRDYSEAQFISYVETTVSPLEILCPVGQIRFNRF